MRLRNIPGAQDAILESPYVVQEPQTKKGHWTEVFEKKQPLHIEVGMGKRCDCFLSVRCAGTGELPGTVG